MSESYPFLVLEGPSSQAVDWVTGQLTRIGMQVISTFDLQDARQDPVECPCPNHGTTACDCQMVVLLVYGESRSPVTLVAHSHDGKTWFSLVDSPQQRADPHLGRSIRQAFSMLRITQA